KLLTNTLGGEIGVSSERDEGSTFRVRLMLSAVDRPNTAPAPERKIVSYTGPRRTIVVVDDNEDHRDLMREVLAPLDFVVLTAAGGPKCLTLIEGVKADLFLVDISMPGMNGWQLADRLRETGQTAPILMLSANIGDGSVSNGGSDAHNDTIAKPVDVRRLRDKLANYLGLDWIYADEQQTARKTGAPERPKPPAAGHIDELVRLGEIGYIRGIEAKLAEVGTDPDHLAFAEALRAHVQAFDIPGYLALLKTYETERAETRG
ncbi:MAG: response regulator, partial [Rhizobiaceae bacterium]|nr:response regulator [Rhizobiaceae bacterium]